MVRRRFTPAEIGSFQVAVAKGASVTDLAKKYGFSTSTFRRWARTYGTPFYPHTPSDEDRQLVSEWRAEPTLTAAWNRYRAFAEDDWWSLEARLVTFTPPGQSSWTTSYTNNGDLLEKTGEAQAYEYAYDLSSNLRSVQTTGSAASSVDYVIDGMNRRVGKSASGPSTVSEGLLYDDKGRVVAELDASNNVLSTFVYGLKANVPDYMVRGGTAYRIVSDWRGDVRLVLDTTKTGAAAVVEQIDYDEWGNVTNLVDPSCSQGGTALCWQPFGFAGGVWDVTTGIVRFGARDYDPAMRRWTQKDRSRFGAGYNFFRYANNDPINQVDPTGKDPISAVWGGLELDAAIDSALASAEAVGAAVTGAASAAAGSAGLAGGSAFLLGYQIGQLYNDLNTPTNGDAVNDGLESISHFAKGGRQNVADTGIAAEARAIAAATGKSICEVLAGMYADARCAGDSDRSQKLKTTQKAFGCRGSSGGGP